MLSMELAEAKDDWLWHNDRGLVISWSLVVLVCLWWKEGRVGWRILVMGRWPMHYVVHFSR
jgi:hypothetical protein